MAYNKQTWVTGEVITAEKLNHVEDGIASSSEKSGIPLPPNALIVNVTYDDNTGNYTPDKEFSDLLDAYNNGRAIYAVVDGMGSFPLIAQYGDQDIKSFWWSQIDFKPGGGYDSLSIYDEESETVAYREGMVMDEYFGILPPTPAETGTYELKLSVLPDGATLNWTISL